jgi:hypothetical protein
MDKRLLYALLSVGCFFGAAMLPGAVGMAMLAAMFASFGLCAWHFLLAKQESMSSAQPLMLPSVAEIEALKLAAAAKAAAVAPPIAPQAPPTGSPSMPEPAQVSAKSAIERPITGKAVFDLGEEPPQK